MSARGRPRAAAAVLAHGVSVNAYKQRPFARSLVLVEHLAGLLGGRYADLLRRLSESAADGGGFLDALLSFAGRTLPDASLRAYDANIRRHEARIACQRADFRLTYFQWFAALLVEMTLDAMKSDEAALLRALDEKRKEHAPFLSPYQPSDLRKLACFMATGSGKTLLLHLNLLQFLDYRLFEPDNILLLTPNEALSAQHRAELALSGLDGEGVRVIEITKLYVDGDGSRRPRKGVSLPTSQFEGPNLLLVDEGHKGGTSAADTKGEREWRAIREALAAGNTPENRGFVFEYSATFAQMAAGSTELYDEYAKCVVADFGYARFHGNGYGKDFRILNARARDGRDLTLSAGLLSFYRQVRASGEHPALVADYRLASPLWVALGKSVTAANSDAAALLEFLDHAARDTGWLAAQFDKVRRDVAVMQAGIEGDPLEFGALKDIDARGLAEDAQTRLFGGCGRLRLHLVSDNEVGLRCTGASDDRYCAVVRVGEARKFVEQVRKDGKLEVGEPDKLSGSLFARIESDDNIRFLIGAKMFVEGWSSWRVSAMALMNVGRGAGSEIVQMFGRGVRLRGKGMGLKRAGDAAPEAVRLLETLYVFGVRADYLHTFVETLRHEGVARAVHFWPVREHAPPVDSLGLMVLAGDDAEFDGVVLPDPARDAARITLAGGMTLTVGLGPSAAIGTASRQEYAPDTDWLDAAGLYDAALEWRRRNPAARIVVSPSLAEALVQASRVQTQAGELSGLDIATRRRKAALASECVARALDNALNRARREFFASRMRTEALQLSGNPNFPHHDVDGRSMLAVRIEAETREDLVKELRDRIEALRRGGVFTTESASKLLATLDESVGVGDVSARVQELLKLAATESTDEGAAPLPRLYFDRHLYTPLFIDQPFAETNRQLTLFGGTESGVRLHPPALVGSEAQFVFDLRAFWSSHRETPLWQDCEIYLLRNQARTGFGFFTGAGFYPDFLLWLKRDGKQVLCFVEPKGLGRAWPQAKIELLATLPTQSPPDLPLLGFTVTPTPLSDIQMLQPDVDATSLAEKSVLLQQPDGHYIEQILSAMKTRLT
ncbi:hypothetical protein [Thermomonas haemolytica]|uniref:Type III restriction/modification enzyme restriction subunit n=1 Tax=Thermomonas haemolytica TaxID=141949 RepID=A0A4R3N8F9_9GAMM|nr:hypothetical protein [Thermomonas haemolytica]TCT23199.1 hypothetical protein EDC34_10619 [Thermomonas haemolytica]TNY29560.1 hypothetical protein BV505_04345 [Thermomonas haemolytica]